ncbi:MAG: hypothetical protein OEN01_16125 [Candidatus Krumholzibacteria bacterium]|nr:hypothetical protein [Candidatus Krumholzibacteria bacterium]
MSKVESKYLLAGYYFLFSLVLMGASLKRPIHNWDMIAYAASAKRFEVNDGAALHSFVYEELRQSVPAETYDTLTRGRYRQVVSQDAHAFSQQLPFYQVRLLYITAIFLLAKVGVNIFAATHLVSALSVALGTWLMLFTFRPHVDTLYLYVLPVAGVVLGLPFVARYSTPDGLSFLMVCLTTYLLMRGHRGVFGILPLCVLARLDLIIFVVLVWIHLWRLGRSRLTAAFSLLATMLIYVGLKKYYGYYDWVTVYYFTFVQTLTHPADVAVDFGLADYLQALTSGVEGAIKSKPFLVYIGLMVMSGFVVVRRLGPRVAGGVTSRYMLFLLVSSFVYVIFHFAFFPDMSERFFIGQYMLATGVLFFLISRRGHLDDNHPGKSADKMAGIE